MKDQTLLNISLIVGGIGLLGLFLIMSTTDLDDISITSLDQSYIDKKVKISGVVERITSTEKATFIEISQKQTITGVVFEKAELQKGAMVEIIGKVDEYQGKKEIIVEKITTK